MIQFLGLFSLLLFSACAGFGDVFEDGFRTSGLPGEYELTITVTLSGSPQKLSPEPTIIDDSHTILFGSLRNGKFSSQGLEATISGSVVKFNCDNKGSDFECTSEGSVSTPGGNFDSVSTAFVRTSDNTNVTQFSVPIVTGFSADGNDTESGWSGENGKIADATGDATNGAPTGSDIEYVKIGKDASPPTTIYVFIKVTSTVNTTIDYRFTLANSTYSEILFETSDSGGFNTDYRLNDTSHQTITGLALNTPGAAGTIEFSVPISTLTNPVTVQASSLVDLSVVVDTEPDGSDTDYDSLKPLLFANF